MKTGRNDPCPCGSGKKFKKCCQEKLEVLSKKAPSSDIGPLVELFNTGRYEELESRTRLVTEHYPQSGAAWKVLGVALLVQGKEALPELKKAAKLLPDDSEVHNNLGLALAATWQLDDAVLCYRQALKIKPNFAEAYNNMGNALKDTGRLDEAIACYRHAVALVPSYTQAHSNLIYLHYFHPAFDEASILAQAKQFTVGQKVPNDSLIEVNKNPKKKLRIGYVSPDFRNHCQSLFTIPLLSNHDHSQFEIYCYAQLAKVDEISQRLAGYADVWRSTSGMSDAQLAEIITNDDINILIDLTMHMSYGRPLLFARRAAPIQVAWLAYPGTTGIPAMDYRLTDPWLDPIELSDDRYTENTIRLPDTFWCYDPLVEGLEPNELPALANGYITFGCLNNFCKVSDDTLSRWGKIMSSVPLSRLILLAAPGRHRQRVLNLLGHQGVAADRVEFVVFQLRSDYLQTYHRIDLCLDTLPYNGHTTSLDAYWMGVPVVTQVGQTIVGRAGWSQLNNLGLSGLAAFDEQAFIDIAVTLSADLPRLSQLRHSLRSCMESSPLMDGKRFARAIEAIYNQIWYGR
jgi:predicted O-linked N-acetylglucosamine transferase (SPINDLY family)